MPISNSHKEGLQEKDKDSNAEVEDNDDPFLH